MKVLVTGSTGQIGSFLCEELIERGDSVVRCDVRKTDGPVANKNDVFEMVDVSSSADVMNVTKTHSPDCIVHLAAVVLVESLNNPGLSYRVNIIGTNNVLEAARRFNVNKVVFASSVVVYGARQGRREEVVSEDDLPNPPPDPYSTSKYTVELMGRHYKEAHGMDINCMRIAAAWGPGRYTGYTGKFNDYLRKVAIGDPPTFPDDFAYSGASLRWLYVKDVANVFAHAARSSRPSRYLYNTGSKVPFKSTDVLAALNTILPGKNLTLEETNEPTKLSSGVAGPNGLDVDCTRLYQELGFIPRFTLETAVRDMTNYERALVSLPPI